MPAVLAPHPVPHSNRPIIAGGIVVAAALPLFLIAGWPFAGWAIAAVLWVAVAGDRAGSPADAPRHG